MPNPNSVVKATTIRDIMFDNDDVIETYFTMLAGGELWDGATHQLLLDLDNHAVVYRKIGLVEARPNDAGRCLRLLHEVHEYRNVDEEILFDPDNDSMSLDNFGYQAWLKGVAAAIEKAFRQPAG